MANITTPPVLKMSRSGQRISLYFGPALPTQRHKFPNIKYDLELIRDSVVTILLTRIGERLFQPDFGSRLLDTVFEPNDLATEALIEESIQTALSKWEPRVGIHKISTMADENNLYINISLVMKRLNIPFTVPIEVTRGRSQEF